MHPRRFHLQLGQLRKHLLRDQVGMKAEGLAQLHDRPAQQLQLALASPHLSQIQRERYQARLDEVRDFILSTRKRQLGEGGEQGQQQPAGRHGG